MIIFGKPLHRKYVKKITIIFLILISVLLMSCNKLEFDPTTGFFRYILQQEKK
jgi:hypothetical protein